ncbi:MAG: hypothetical protein PHV61_04090 [Limnochordia bacterium]|jgi:type II secretory pathway component GspD/PulD (secretin)|nr:hypothetical protein [Limnochordia bacterium]MDD4518076.1 hypothetical protein [Limnochordia bacterium]
MINVISQRFATDPEISDSAGTSSSSGLPSTNDRSVSTTVRVKDGETIVIGGLI